MIQQNIDLQLYLHHNPYKSMSSVQNVKNSHKVAHLSLISFLRVTLEQPYQNMVPSSKQLPYGVYHQRTCLYDKGSY